MKKLLRKIRINVFGTRSKLYKGKFNGLEPIKFEKDLFKKGRKYSVSMKTFVVNQNVNVNFDDYKSVDADNKYLWNSSQSWEDILGENSTRDRQEFITHYFILTKNNQIVFHVDKIGMIDTLKVGLYSFGKVSVDGYFEIRSDNENSTDGFYIKEV